MPRTRASAAAIKSEPEKPVETEEHVDFEGDNEEEEEIEYEEVEEEVEMEEEEEEEVEEEVEEEEEEEEEEENGSDGAGEGKGSEDVKMKVDVDAEDMEKKHAELLALPPHGSEVYIGGITHDISEADVREFCETIGEVTEVNSFLVHYLFFIGIPNFTRMTCMKMPGKNNEREGLNSEQRICICYL